MKCLECQKDKTELYLGVCHDCHLESISRQLQRGSIPTKLYESGQPTQHGNSAFQLPERRCSQHMNTTSPIHLIWLLVRYVLLSPPEVP